MTIKQNLPQRWLVVATLMLVYGLLISSALQKSATVDEQSHLFRGVAYLREGDTHFLLGHPLGASSLSALPVLTEPNLALPLDMPAWEAGNWSLAGDAFLWRMNQDPQRILFLGRLPVMWLTLLLLALVYRWGLALAGKNAALLAFVFVAFDPNVLANGRIISGDLSLTLFFILTIYGYWCWAVRGTGWHGLLLAGIGLGLASVSKFNAGLLLPILVLIAASLSWRQRNWRPLLVLLWVGVVGGVVIWSVYGFALRPLPGGAFWDDLFWVLDYFGRPHGSYLLGRYSTTGWWYYFPVAFAIKTPLPLLFMLMAAIAASFWQWRKSGTQSGTEGKRSFTEKSGGSLGLFLLLPVGLYFGVSLTSSLNIGYRYLLPTLPLLWLFTAVTLNKIRFEKQRYLQIAGTAVALWLMGQAIFIWPDYLPFFNIVAGGEDDQWRLLSDSNIDWGQDLPALAAWQQASGQPVKLSYFGTAYPSAYGLDFEPLPMWLPAPEQAMPGRQLYDPQNPAPGVYALSVTSLHGIVLGGQREAFAWFRTQEPLARLGNSIFLYEVQPRGEPIDVVLAGLEPADLAPELRERLTGNQWQVRWVDGRNALLWPKNDGYLAIAKDEPIDEELQSYLAEQELVEQTAEQSLYELTTPLTSQGENPHPFANLLTLQKASYTITEENDVSEIEFLTTWGVLAETSQSIKIFIHAINEREEIVAQWDGLAVEPTSWRDGDLFIHAHHLTLPEGESPNHFLIGIYDGETLDRLGEPMVVPWEN